MELSLIAVIVAAIPCFITSMVEIAHTACSSIYAGVCCMQELRMVFNSNMLTKLEFQVSVEDRFAQKSIEVYRGFVQLFTDASQTCSLSQPRKPCDDSRTRPTANNQTGKVRVRLLNGLY